MRKWLYDASCDAIGLLIGGLLGLASVVILKLQGRS